LIIDVCGEGVWRHWCFKALIRGESRLMLQCPEYPCRNARLTNFVVGLVPHYARCSRNNPRRVWLMRSWRATAGAVRNGLSAVPRRPFAPISSASVSFFECLSPPLDPAALRCAALPRRRFSARAHFAAARGGTRPEPLSGANK
jgi:hypothetical protein